MARPKFKINYDEVEKLSSIMCTQEEIASFLGCSVDTLQRDKEFYGIYKKGLDIGKMSLRRKQFKLANTNATMAIWLGKQYLDQRDDYINADDEEKINNVKSILVKIKEVANDKPTN